MLKISIITVCYNSAATIEDTLFSVAEQDYGNVEHILIDGGSTDGTVDIIANSQTVSNYVSEPDSGIYDAMNKGISMATGDVIGILNADDFYVSNDVLSKVAGVFINQDIDAVYADLVYVQQHNADNVVRYWKSRPFEPGLFRQGWMPAHPTFFCRKEAYEKCGVFDLGYRIAADVELLFRFLEKCRFKTTYLPEVIIKMRLGGTTNQSLDNIKRQNQEVLSFLDTHYGRRISRFRFFTGKLFNRLGQFFRRP